MKTHCFSLQTNLIDNVQKCQVLDMVMLGHQTVLVHTQKLSTNLVSPFLPGQVSSALVETIQINRPKNASVPHLKMWTHILNHITIDH